MAVLGLRFCARAFSSCGKWGPLFIAVRGPLTIAASLVAEHRPQTRRLSSCGSRAQLLRGMWDPPRPGLEPVSPALAGRLSTTAPPGKPEGENFKSAKHQYLTMKFSKSLLRTNSWDLQFGLWNISTGLLDLPFIKRDRERVHASERVRVLFASSVLCFGGRSTVSSITCVMNISFSSSLAQGDFSEVYDANSLECEMSKLTSISLF